MLEDDDELTHQAYFEAIEEVFVRLRGAPLLLSPTDWQVARGWHRQGVPLELVRRVLEEVFAKRRERGTKGRISSLRYCAPAVEAAWSAAREMAAPGDREAARALDLPVRLASLAAALPDGLPERGALAARIVALAGDSEAVEAALATLDHEALDHADRGLDEPARAELDAAVTATLAALAGRLPPEELERSRERLRRQVLRGRLGMPVLSLFSPEAGG